MDVKTSWYMFWLILLLVPSAASQTTADLIWEDGEVGEMIVWRVDEEPRADNSASIMGDSTWIRFTPYESAIPQSIMFIDIWITPSFRSTSDGSWNYSFEASTNGVSEWNNCWAPIATIEAGGVLAGDLVTNPSIPLRCAVIVSLNDDEPFQWWLNRTVLSGNPDTPEETSISIIINRGEFIVTSSPTAFETITGLTGIEFAFLVAAAFIGVILWSRSTDVGVRAFGAMLPLLSGILLILVGLENGLGNVWAGLTGSAITFMVIGGYMLLRMFIDEWGS